MSEQIFNPLQAHIKSLQEENSRLREREKELVEALNDGRNAVIHLADVANDDEPNALQAANEGLAFLQKSKSLLSKFEVPNV